MLRLLLSLQIDGMAVCAVDTGQIVWCDSGFSTLTGYTHDELLAMSVDALVPDSIRFRHAVLRGEFAAHPTNRKLGTGPALLLKHRSGQERACHIGLSPQPDGLVAVAVQLHK
jgi:PAS domain-containing protein